VTCVQSAPFRRVGWVLPDGSLSAGTDGCQNHRRRALDAVQRARKHLTVAAVQVNVIASGLTNIESDRFADDDWDGDDAMPNAGVGARLLAVIIDLLILTVVDVIIIYFTMQLCYLTPDDLWMLPKGPLFAFLLVQNGGYLVAFTAGGQTLGKMAAGIRVVQWETDASLDLGRAFLRTLMWAILAIPAGLGFLTAVFSRDHRGLHDRFAGTRVVRASA